ncbi:4-phosphoerythronate dehydrogenase PdxB [Plesiomonas sp.]|uniref:4-phosphoerythronate dehydrogenase PdxB n=1 Tax=Plesiomonas sp. TaxID=2486279 RepID=UPI003F3A7D07
MNDAAKNPQLNLNIVVDENMPYARELFGQIGRVHPVAGRPMPTEVLTNADALMVRSVTQVNQALLQKTSVGFVGTATAGFDHVDTAWLAESGIGFSSAPGCNAVGVVEYVISALLIQAEQSGFLLQDKTVGIVGVGNVGSRLHQRLQALGINTLLCDPPRAAREGGAEFVSFEHIVAHADVLTFHTPLIKTGDYPTRHIVNADVLAALPDGCILINAARGAVVDNQALLNAMQQGKKLHLIMDVWENEPQILLPLLPFVDIATPHIAGYSLEGKARGTAQVFDAYCQHIGHQARADLQTLLPPPDIAQVQIQGEIDQALLMRLAHLVYDVRRDDAPLRRGAALTGEFDRLRKHYPERREWSSLTVCCDNLQSVQFLRNIGFSACVAEK